MDGDSIGQFATGRFIQKNQKEPLKIEIAIVKRVSWSLTHKQLIENILEGLRKPFDVNNALQRRTQ